MIIVVPRRIKPTGKGNSEELRKVGQWKRHIGKTR
jgi:hypothetical protein